MNKLRKEFENSNFWNFMGFEFIECENERAIIKFKKEDKFNNVMGFMHGGIYMSALDTVMGMAVRSLGFNNTVTIQMETKFLKSTVNGTLYAVGKIIYKLNKTILVEGILKNENGETVAFSIGTFKAAN